ncbi:UDP-Glycosyltransferase/glycogen phosphorylase, partial [Neoconidiobolus thromboides FSU 785]
SLPLKIVLHSVFGGRSHIKGILEIGNELTKRGHKVTYVTLEHNIKFVDGYSIGNYSLGKAPIDETIVLKDLKKSLFEKDKRSTMVRAAKLIADLWEGDYESVYLPLKDYVIEEKPDLIVSDFLSYSCKDLAKNLGVPLISGFQAIDGSGIINVPYISMGSEYGPVYTKDMSFYQRFHSQVIAPLSLFLKFRTLYNGLDIIRKKHNVNPTAEIYGDSNYGLSIANTFVGFEPAIPMPPGIIQVGPIISENKATLTTELDGFLNANENILFIAFGSNYMLIPSISGKLLETSLLAIKEGIIDGVVWGLGRTNQDDFPLEVNDGKGGKVKVQDFFEGKDDKVKLLSWAPQVPILEHKNTKLFISHGGLESTFEAVYSGTPVLCLALSGDQPRNARKIEEAGIGLYVDKFNLSPKSLKEQFKTIIEDKNDKFKSNLSRMKTISHHNSRRLRYAADLFEQHAYTAKACRKYEPYDPNSNLPPCELKHLIPVSQQMSPISAYGIDIYGMAILILLSSFILSLYSLYQLSKLIFKYF